MEFRKALLLNPEKAIAYDNLAIMLALQGKFSEAGPVVEQGLANARPLEGEEYERLTKRKDSMCHSGARRSTRGRPPRSARR